MVFGSGVIKNNRLAVSTNLLQSLKSLPYEKNYYLNCGAKLLPKYFMAIKYNVKKD